jgi:hypothetical protein
VKSVPGGNTRIIYKIRRNSAKYAQSEHKECTYTRSSVKSQGKEVKGVHTRVTENYESECKECVEESVKS